MLKKILFVFVFTIGGWRVSSGQAWVNYNTGNSGLTENSIRCIAIDGLGRKWIGTDYGLDVFDGTNWTIYLTTNSGIPDNGIRTIVFDSTGNAWIGTFNSGLVKFDGTTWTTYDINNSPLPDNFVKALAFDLTGALWIGTINGIARYDGTTWQTYTTVNTILTVANISDIQVMPNNDKIFGTINGGLIVFKNDTVNAVLTIANGSGIPDNTQLDFALDSMNNLWFASAADGLVAYRGPLGWFWYYQGNSQIPTNDLTSVKFSADESVLWIGTVDSGLVKKTGIFFSSFTAQNSGLPDNYIQCMIVDSNDVVWIGTASSGVVRFDESQLSSAYIYEQSGMNSYPNPCTDYIVLKGFESGKRNSVSVYDREGRKLLSENIYSDSFRLDTKKFVPGIYMVTFVSEGGKPGSLKIVRQ